MMEWLILAAVVGCVIFSFVSPGPPPPEPPPPLTPEEREACERFAKYGPATTEFLRAREAERGTGWEANPNGVSGRVVRGYRHWRHKR